MARFYAPSEKQGFKWGTLWWTLSVLVHVALVCCVVYFSPLRDWFLGRSDPSENLDRISPSRVSKALQAMIESHTIEVALELERGQACLSDLDGRRDRVYQRYVKDAEWLRKSFKQAPPVVPLEAIRGKDEKTRELAAMSFKGKDLFELYYIAQDMERAAIETYRQIQAIELARVSPHGLEAANNVTKVPVPEHPPLLERSKAPQAAETAAAEGKPFIDVEVFGQEITRATDPRMNAVGEELNELRSEVSSMVSYMSRMVDLAKGLMGDDVQGVTVVPGSGIMTQFGQGRLGTSERPEDGMFQGYSPPDPKAYDHPWGHGIGPVTHRDELFQPEAAEDLGQRRPMPGRKIVQQGTLSGVWMYIDTWYIIGPFENPDRKLLDYPFPPEATIDRGIDLDAQYFGWKKEPVRWRFRKSAEVCVLPHDPRDYAIWYAYTEIYSDRDQVRTCIFGSDDYGKAWVNGEPVYGSGKTPHPWYPNRGYAQVKFRQGFNRVLFKLENAWGMTGFSMCVLVDEG